MSVIRTLLGTTPYFNWPNSVEGWLVWLGLLGVVAYLLYRWRDLNKPLDGSRLALLVLFATLVPITSLFGGIRLPPGQALPPPGLPIEPKGPAMMVFAAIPWVLAAGLLGSLPAAGLAALSGALIGLWDTHNPFAPLEYALLGVLMASAVRQRYRTGFFQVLRHPVVAALLLSAVYPLLYLVDALALTGGPVAARLDFALTRVGMISLAVAGQLLLAGLVAEVVAITWKRGWGWPKYLVPSPAEKSIQTRFQYAIGVLIAILVVMLMVGDWIVAGRAARQMLRQRMEDTAQMGAESIPFFLETGQNLILQIASDNALYAVSPSRLPDVLADHLRSAPYFRQLFVLDDEGQPVAGYPVRHFESLFPTPEEQVGFNLALQGVAFQYYTVPPVEGEKAAQISFIAPIKDISGDVRGVLLGRSDLATNPFTKPLLSNLDNIASLGGEGMLVDESGRILYHPLPSLVMTTYTGQMSDAPMFFDETGPDGTRRIVYFQPVIGRSWAEVLAIPAQQAQQLALNIAAPLLGLLLVLSLVILLLMRYGLRVVTASLQSLAGEADRIAHGQLDHQLAPRGVDEVGQLTSAFEEMRVRLRDRLDELNRLLFVSQGVASSLEIEEAIKPVLEAALVAGASSARIVLSPEALPESLEMELTAFGMGERTEEYSYLDEQLLSLTSLQSKVELTNPSRARVLNFDKQSLVPAALLAFALRHESLYYGTLWIGYDQPHRFLEEEVRFLTTIAGQAALAVANGRLFLSAEIGRQWLEAILNSSPDPVLVTNNQNKLLLANPAAIQALAVGVGTGEGLPIGQVITPPVIIDLLQSSDDEERTAEITMPDGRHYYAIASTIWVDGNQTGRVCVLQDITRFRELDTLKTEFVTNVSHDMRSPLALIRGYASMLQMVGDLNEQQLSHVRKIVVKVDEISHLVHNLLDLGRLEAGIALKLELVPVPDLVEKVTGGLQIQAGQKRINLVVDIPAHISPLVEADQALLEQALSNLVENAIKYTGQGGRVQVRVTERADRLVFEVTDTGVGIAPVDKARIFEKFYRGGGPETKFQRGSGLGLAIVKSIAERHYGRVWVDSRLGKGSSFFLEIPIRQEEHSKQRVR